MAMANLLTGLRDLLRGSPRPAANEPPAPADTGGGGGGLRLDRFRTHPQLVEVWPDAPPARRTRFRSQAGGDPLGEMPRGVTRFLLRLPHESVGPTGVSWEAFGSPGGRVTFVSGEPLQPRVSPGTRVRLEWDAPAGLSRVRIVPLRWAGGRAPVVAPPVTVPAAASGWEVPADWLTTDPLELRLTPLGEGGQGLTECLLLPGRRPRVETVFRRVMLTPPGRSTPRRRLQVEVRAAGPLAPAVVLVEWRPRDSGVPAEDVVRAEWPAAGTTLRVDLPNISMRGDRVTVRFEPPAEPTHQFAWFHADESGYGTPTADAVLSDGRGLEAAAFEYVHGVERPSGEAVQLLADPEATDAGGWPTSVLASAGELGVEVGEFVRRPHAHTLDAHEGRLRVLRERFGDPAVPTVLAHLLRAADGCSPADAKRLHGYAAGCDDPELDRWVEAVAAGAGVERLLTFWTDPKWGQVGAWQVVASAAQLEDVRREPLSALLAEVLPASPLGGDLRRAVEQEERLPAAAPAEFARAACVRRWVLGGCADHWARLLPADADERCRRLADRLRTAPASAARELADLRANGSVRLRPSGEPLLLIETVPAAGEGTRLYDWQLRRRAAADWYHTLFTARVVPAWPWYGLLAADRSTADVRAEWEAVRTGLPTADRPPPDALADRLSELRAAVAPLDDDDLRRVADDTLSHAAALAEWLR